MLRGADSLTQTQMQETLSENLPAESTTPVPPRKRTRRFYLRGRNFYLTFSQCSVSKETARDNLYAKYGEELEWFVCGQERHQDGNLHLHMVFRFNTRKYITGSDCFDFVTGQHGNYQLANSVLRTLKYCTKDDHAYLVEGDIDVKSRLTKNGGNQADAVANRIKSGKTLQEIDAKYPGYFLRYGPQIKRYQQQQQAWDRRSSLRPHPNGFAIPSEYLALDNAQVQICEWIVANFPKPPAVRAKDAKALYLVGPTGLGKTRFFNRLSKYLLRYNVPRGEDFYDFYQDGYYDFAFIDEFRAQKTLTWLNSFCNGREQLNMRIKGGQLEKRQNLPVVICSNYYPAECYRKLVETRGDEVLAPFERRILLVEPRNEITIEPKIMVQYADFLADAAT